MHHEFAATKSLDSLKLVLDLQWRRHFRGHLTCMIEESIRTYTFKSHGGIGGMDSVCLPSIRRVLYK